MVFTHNYMHPIERHLIYELRPIFIGSDYIEEENTLNIIISCKSFNFVPIDIRIAIVYDILEKYEGEKPVIIVQAYNEEEINDILEAIL